MQQRGVYIGRFLTTMSSSVTRGWRLLTVILVPSKGLTAGWTAGGETLIKQTALDVVATIHF